MILSVLEYSLCNEYCVVLASVFFACEQSEATPVQWPANGHYYEVISVPGGIAWDDANAAATVVGRYLATIHSPAENDFVFSLVDFSEFWSDPAGPTVKVPGWADSNHRRPRCRTPIGNG